VSSGTRTFDDAVDDVYSIEHNRHVFAIRRLREFSGPGWRLYYVVRGGTLIVMLGGDDGELAHALGHIAKARGMAQIAKDAGIGRESLYKALRPDANPRFDTISRVCKALGVRLVAQPLAAPAPTLKQLQGIVKGANATGYRERGAPR